MEDDPDLARPRRVSRPGWAEASDIAPRRASTEQLVYLAGFARGLTGTDAPRSAEDARELGCMMLELLGHIAHLEQRV